VRRLAAAAVALAAAVAAGCGGSGGDKSLPAGAAKAPADAVAFVSLKADRGSAQWKQALALAARFPALAARLDELHRYQDAVGRELDLVWLDFANGGEDVVALTKPRNLARLKTAVDPNGATYSELSDGWVAVADTRSLLRRYERAAGGDTLDGDKAFEDGFGKLAGSDAVRAWLRGSAVQAALDRALVREGAAPRVSHGAGDLRSLAASAKAESVGIRLDAFALLDPTPNATTFEPTLPSSFPAGALLYVSAAGVDAPTRLILRMVGDSKPDFDRQLAQVEGVLGITLQGDVYPLLKRESAVALYPGRTPSLLYMLAVPDEGKADSLVRRIAAVAQLSGDFRVEAATVGGTSVQMLTMKGSNVTVIAGVANKRLFVTNSRTLAEQAVHGPASSLADEERFREARQRARLPSKVTALAYGDVQRGLQLLRGAVPPGTAANAKPFERALLYLVPDEDGLRLAGFTAIE
jgi:hypothetical protein